MERARGVTAIALLSFCVSGYLAAIAVIKLLSPGSVSLSLGAPFLHGLEISGPIMFLMASVIGLVIGYGLLRLINFARRAAIMVALAGMVMLIPKVSANAFDISLRFFVAGFGLMVRVVIVWYLWQISTAEHFSKPK